MKITLPTLKPAEMQKLENNQKKFKKDAPVTTMATFKLSYLKELIKEIEANPKYANDDDFTHNICITLVRDNFKKELLQYLSCHNHAAVKKRGVPKNDKQYTQLIPIITGCLAKLDETNHYNTKSFKFMTREDGNIPYVRSGGEGSGLIPPPPGDDDDV